ncbi:MAG: hypothetical protein J6T70_10150 [Bacteroidales bacterium]|nr:hypothetical protein [Bacteroidales bacterium]
MRKIEKIIWSQDAFFKTEPRKSGETSINLSNEIFDFLGSVENGYITFKIYKEDYLKALCSLSLLLPLYTSSSKEATLKQYSNKFFDDCYKLILKKFGDSDSVNYKVHSLKREDGRIYLNELKESETGFNIRYFFVQSHSVVTFVQKDDGTYELRFRNSITELSKDQISDAEEEETLEIPDTFRPLLTAIRTKPFILLAGISGTGKSRIVRELAFKSCPKYLQDKDHTTPGNYCMIEVKPNWHDSTELLGYYSNIHKGYQFKKFVKFLVKAKMFPDVPFFVCLDEMNLAPVEHYFAEILSILETRKNTNNGIKTDVIIEPRYFVEYLKIGGYIPGNTDRDIYLKLFAIDTESDIDAEIGNRNDLTTVGLTLPGNVIIIGTVNMDDTTHQFSRKVIDRAMTIEMNGGNLSDMFGGSKNLDYLTDEDEQKKWQSAFTQQFVTADEVLDYYPDKANDIKTKVVEALNNINKALKGTPFEVSYRVLNELTIMVGVMLGDAGDDANLENIINQAVDNILLMKILPRIEGDADMFTLSKDFQNQNNITHDNRLEWLLELSPDISTDSDASAPHNTAKDKIKEMLQRLDNQGFTRFWP